MFIIGIPLVLIFNRNITVLLSTEDLHKLLSWYETYGSKYRELLRKCDHFCPIL